MSYSLYETVAFGGSKAALTTVGYQLYNADGTASGSRIATGIQNIGDGAFGATITFPTGFQGRITWDTGEATPIYASAPVNPEDDEDQDIILNELSQLTAACTDCRTPVLVPRGVLSDLTLIRAGIPANDGCPVLRRISAFLVDQGAAATLEHVFRRRDGNPADLSAYLATNQSESLSASMVAEDGNGGSVKLVVKEWTAVGPNRITDPIWTVAGQAYDPEHGILRATLTPDIVEHAGIYELSWGIFDVAGNFIIANQAMLSVEHTLFPQHQSTLWKPGYPMTVGEIRMSIVDSDPNDNLLLDDVEFSDAQILEAIMDPVRIWNEALPPLRKKYSTRTFPFRSNWLRAVSGKLHLMAANNYRRNYLQAQAAGIQVPDKAKEPQYMQEGLRLMQEYGTWVQNTKVSINMRGFVGSSSSEYLYWNGGW